MDVNEKELLDMLQPTCSLTEPPLKCGEIFYQSPNILSLICVICDKKFDELGTFGNHLIDDHFKDQSEFKYEPFESFIFPSNRHEEDSQIEVKREMVEKEAFEEVETENQQIVDSAIFPKNDEDDSLKPDPDNDEDNGEKANLYRIDNGRYICNMCGLKYSHESTCRTHLRKIHEVQMKCRRSRSLNNKNNKKSAHSSLDLDDDVDDRPSYTQTKKLKKPINRPSQASETKGADQIISDGMTESRKKETTTDVIASTQPSEISTEIECDICGIKYGKKYAYIQHMTDVHNQNLPNPEGQLFKCSICGFTCAHQESFFKHLQKEHDTTGICNSLGIEKQDQEQTVTCSSCGRLFPSDIELQVHVTREHSKDPTKRLCKYCGQYFKGKYELRMHTESEHSSEFKHKCPHCDRQFAVVASLTNHILLHTGERPHKCKYCDKGFTSAMMLTDHVRRHLNIKKVSCRHCNMKFVGMSERNSHEKRMHLKERPFQCETCGERFFTNTLLTYHRRRHTNERNAICPICNKAFLCNRSLKNHLETHNEVGTYECSVCKKAFKARKGLAQHMKLHDAVKKYVCTICGAAYAQAAGLSSHKKTHIKEGIIC